ncbi:uncharacterized protein LOC134680602 [Mytilus trossulus]|uniref:uncharacterized protein LOC134680602 n=1 Tax=Mytilus trossulus TaxID=6551 RepID=UPI003007A114
MTDFWSQSYDQSTYLRQHSSKVQQYNVRTCGKDTALTTAWEISDSDDVDQIIVMTEERIIKRSGRNDRVLIKQIELTALTIACLFGELKLVKKLVENGANVDHPANGEQSSLEYHNNVPPIYCAAINCDIEILNILIDAGVDVNKFQGLPQDINIENPSDTRAIIGPYSYPNTLWGLNKPSPDPKLLIKVLELYLNAGVKLNTTSWGPCLFLGRGRVFTVKFPTTWIPPPWFVCTSSVLLLQHGVDPNLYSLRHIMKQLGPHFKHFRKHDYCVKDKLFLRTFLAAGYRLTATDIKYVENKYIKDRFDFGKDDEFMQITGRLASLKHLARTKIRSHIISVNKDTSIFPAVDMLELPVTLKDFLKLYDVSPPDLSLVICFEQIQKRNVSADEF